MTTRSGPSRRAWLSGGALAVVVLLAAGWLGLIGPQYGRLADLHDRTLTAQLRVPALQKRLADLRELDPAAAEALVGRDRLALPAEPATEDLLRYLRAAEAAADVTVTELAVQSPVAVPSGAGAYALPVAVTATGEPAELAAFLQQVQQVQPRAVLITRADLTPQDTEDPAGATTLRLAAQVFVAAPLPS